MNSSRKVALTVAVALLLVLSSTAFFSITGNISGGHQSQSPGTLSFLQGSVVPSSNPNISTAKDIPGVIGNISLGFDGVYGVSSDPLNGYLYVITGGSDEVSVMNSTGFNFITNISVGTGAGEIACDLLNGNLFVTENGGIVVINGSQNSVVANISVGADASYISFDSNNNCFYVSYPNTVSGYGYVLAISGKNDSVVANITSFIDPYGSAADLTNGYVYVADQAAQKVVIINGTTNDVVKSVSVGNDPLTLAYDPSFQTMLLTNGNRVTVFNASSNQLLKNYTYDNGMFWIAVDSETGNFYLTYPYTGYIYVANGSNGYLEKGIAMPGNPSEEPTSIVFDKSTDSMYFGLSSWSVGVINCSSRDISKIATPGGEPTSVTYDSVNGNLYVAETGSKVAVLNGTTGRQVATIGVNAEYSGMAVEYPSGNIFMGNSGSNYLYYISQSTNKIMKTSSRVYGPQGMTIDRDNGRLYVMNSNQANVSVFNASTGDFINNFRVGATTFQASPFQATWDSLNQNVYYTNNFYNYISEINTTTGSLVNMTTVGPHTGGIATDTWNGYLYVSCTGDGTVSVVNTTNNTLVASIPVGSDPLSVVFDPYNGYIFVANGGSNNVTVINGSTNMVIANISTGSFPQQMAFDSYNGYVYVTNLYSNNMTILGSPSYNATFLETGLASGDWYVNITGTERVNSGPLQYNTSTILSSKGPINESSHTFLLPDGVYHYSISPDTKSTIALPDSGNFTINNSFYAMVITFNYVKGQHGLFNFLTISFLSLVFLVSVSLAAYVVNARKKRK